MSSLEVYSLRVVPRALYEWGHCRCSDVSKRLWCGHSVSGWGAGVCRAQSPEVLGTGWSALTAVLVTECGCVHSSFGARILSADTRRIAPEPVFRVGSAPRSTASRRLDGAVSSGPREVQPRLFLWVRGSGVGPVSPSAERAAAGAVGYLSGLSGRSLRWNLH